ncbi:phosphatidylinositol N-acetylglucosaminyltransferase NDAI_0D02400 [Naumovozyma dairenensis CBS 421]|uniref:Uncharacterized protein n=1 Tax=Naumovozyma dairenensis (strain ATCC 10597 / BCRC 20456 / CBS 421 / NBRC 0211 / NRRL Y-12639) TaxID=1071378 RepID=G0W9U3_NAUDC|nr:hypothetical protein NDAI_0D02400 [Naumovozyma dairenensis CBS 421]CCD24554.1 hypothetical protein NDAI_0D02400 [Naumovozyma dairenensis CBS 421]
MSNYVFWPRELRDKEKRYESNESIVALAISLEGANTVVLDVLPQELFLHDINLKSPYSLVAIRPKGSNMWVFEDEDSFIIEFLAPPLKSMRFFSLEPIPLILPEKETTDENLLPLAADNFQLLSNHIRYHTTDSRLRATLRLINLFHKHVQELKDLYPTLFTNETIALDYTKVDYMYTWYTSTGLHRFIGCTFLYVSVCICQTAKLVSNSLSTLSIPLVDISATARQIDLRCQQLCYFPLQYVQIKNKISSLWSKEHPSNASEKTDILKEDLPSQYYPEYIRFFNTIWLILNDISFGLILAAIIGQYFDFIISMFHFVVHFFINNILIKGSKTLANNPFGVKLNEELGVFLSDIFLWIISFFYESFIEPITRENNLGIFLKITIQVTCCIGCSFGISMIVDFFSILFLPIYIFYHISRKLYHWDLSIMLSLFYLFCGKKNNVLRDRIDHNYFQLDQMLVGTVLFIILLFLTPTVLAFYVFYTFLQMTVVSVEIGLESLIALINHFPLFVLMLRLKDPKRIPGGISIVKKVTDIHTNEAYVLQLQNSPIKIGTMFKPYSALMTQMKINYFSVGTVKKIAGGLPIMMNRNKLYYILYSSLPKTSPSILELYLPLKDALVGKQQE